MAQHESYRTCDLCRERTGAHGSTECDLFVNSLKRVLVVNDLCDECADLIIDAIENIKRTNVEIVQPRQPINA